MRQRSLYLDRLGIWTDWARSSFVTALDSAMRDARRRLGPRHPRLRAHFSEAERASCQAALTALLRDPELTGAMRRVRRRLDRWQVPLLRGRRPDRFAKGLASLSRLAPPRAAATQIRTAFNGWPTCRRFQGHGRCCLGCTGEDRIEHYARRA